MELIRVVDTQGAIWFRTELTGWEKNKERIEETHIANSVNGMTYMPNPDRSTYSRAGKSVHQFTMDKRYIKSFPSLTKASLATGVSVISISKCTRGLQKHAGSFLWQTV